MPGDAGTFRTIAKETAVISKFNIVSLKADGSKIGEWTLTNPWISQASMGEYDYSADDLMGMDITVKYDWARYKAISDTKAENVLAQ